MRTQLQDGETQPRASAMPHFCNLFKTLGIIQQLPAKCKGVETRHPLSLDEDNPQQACQQDLLLMTQANAIIAPLMNGFSKRRQCESQSRETGLSNMRQSRRASDTVWYKGPNTIW
jgi:hypothetical protein